MEEKYLGPLLGVFLGWLLTSLSSRLKEHKEKKQIIGKLISELIFIHSQILTLIAATDALKKNIDEWEKYEIIRKIINDKHFLEPSSKYEKFQKYIEQISGLYPLESHEIQSLYDLLLKSKNSSLLSTSKNKKLYVKFLSIYEAGLDLILKKLIRIIKKFSLRFSFITYLKVLILLKKTQQNIKNSKDYLNKFAPEAFKPINEKP